MPLLGLSRMARCCRVVPLKPSQEALHPSRCAKPTSVKSVPEDPQERGSVLMRGDRERWNCDEGGELDGGDRVLKRAGEETSGERKREEASTFAISL